MTGVSPTYGEDSTPSGRLVLSQGDHNKTNRKAQTLDTNDVARGKAEGMRGAFPLRMKPHSGLLGYPISPQDRQTAVGRVGNTIAFGIDSKESARGGWAYTGKKNVYRG